MDYSRQHVVDTLRRAGFSEVADAAMAELPDPVDEDRVREWGMKRGITHDVLTSSMGGSP